VGQGQAAGKVAVRLEAMTPARGDEVERTRVRCIPEAQRRLRARSEHMPQRAKGGVASVAGECGGFAHSSGYRAWVASKHTGLRSAGLGGLRRVRWLAAGVGANSTLTALTIPRTDKPSQSAIPVDCQGGRAQSWSWRRLGGRSIRGISPAAQGVVARSPPSL